MQGDLINMAEAKPDRTAIVIYRPQDGDNPITWINYGESEDATIRFRANEPVTVPYSLRINQLHTEQKETKDGTIARVTKEVKVPLVEVLRKNPAFEVDGVQAERKRPLSRIPDTADEYRNYAIAWIVASMSAKAMTLRWESEQGLRERCGVTGADLAHILPLYENRKAECAALDAQRAA